MKFIKIFILSTTVSIILLILISCFIFADNSGSKNLPEAPKLEQSTTATQVSNYTSLLKAQQEQRNSVFDSVTKALNNVFTAIIAAVLTYAIPKAVIAAFEIKENGFYKKDDSF